MTKTDISRIAVEYARRFPADADTVHELRQLIAIRAAITSRTEFRGHITCGGIVVDRDRGRILMIHHAILDRWLFPGGHVEPGDATVRDVAIREIAEETGIGRDRLVDPGDWLDRIPLHIDRHTIPANPGKGEPTHPHFDFRYLFYGSPVPVLLQAEEVKDWAWVEPSRTPAPMHARFHQLGIV
jgi:8-oxo-dGTP pyrophosphatase MutT (NUDIX family)